MFNLSFTPAELGVLFDLVNHARGDARKNLDEPEAADRLHTLERIYRNLVDEARRQTQE